MSFAGRSILIRDNDEPRMEYLPGGVARQRAHRDVSRAP